MVPHHFLNTSLVKASSGLHVVTILGSCIYNILEAPGPRAGMGI